MRYINLHFTYLFTYLLTYLVKFLRHFSFTRLSTADGVSLDVSVAAVSWDQLSSWQWQRQDVNGPAASGIIRFSSNWK